MHQGDRSLTYTNKSLGIGNLFFFCHTLADVKHVADVILSINFFARAVQFLILAVSAASVHVHLRLVSEVCHFHFYNSLINIRNLPKGPWMHPVHTNLLMRLGNQTCRPLMKSVRALYLYWANDLVFGKSASVRPCWKVLVTLFQLQARVWAKL